MTTTLISTLQQLSSARDLPSIMQIAKLAARKLNNCDGVTFVLRDGDFCHYADEDAISPLWKNQRFPMKLCISGWAMINRKSVTIENIYNDSRVPVDAYRPTFVKSLLMVPIRKLNPIGALGCYWATNRSPTDDEMTTLEVLADTVAIALENHVLYEKLEQQIQELEHANQAKDDFLMTVSHELRTPLSSICGWVDLLTRGDLAPEDKPTALQTIDRNAKVLHQIVEDLTEDLGWVYRFLKIL